MISTALLTFSKELISHSLARATESVDTSSLAEHLHFFRFFFHAFCLTYAMVCILEPHLGYLLASSKRKTALFWQSGGTPVPSWGHVTHNEQLFHIPDRSGARERDNGAVAMRVLDPWEIMVASIQLVRVWLSRTAPRFLANYTDTDFR